MLSQIAADSVNIVTPESKKKLRWVKCGLLTKSCTQSRAPRTSSSLIMTRARLMMNFSPEVTGPRTSRTVSWKTYKNTKTYFWLKQSSSLTTFGHDTYFKQMMTSMKTSLRRAKRQDITYVRAAPRRRPLQLSLLLDKGLVFRPTGLDLTTFYPPTFQKSIQQKTQRVQRRMIVPSNDDRRAETTHSLSNFGTGSCGGQHRGSELLRKSTGVSLKLLFQIGGPSLVESRQKLCPAQKLSIGNSRKP